MDITSFLKAKAANRALSLNNLTLTPIAFRDMSYVQRNSNANQTGTFKFRIFPQINCQDIKIGYSNIYRNGSNNIVPNVNSITVKATLVTPSYSYPVFFNGQRTVTIAPGATIISDPVGAVIKANDAVYILTYVDAGSGGYIPLCQLFDNATFGDGISYGVDYTDSGSIATVGMTSGYTPSLVLGYSAQQKTSVLLVGDSIMDGTGDNIRTASGSMGFAARALRSSKIGYHKISCGGDTASGFVTNLYCRSPLAVNHKSVICDYATNDIANGATLAPVQSSLLSIWSYFAAKGCKVFQTTIQPRTTSTDNWLTLANQTVQSFESVRLAVNAWLRDTSSSGAVAQSGGALTGIFDTAALVETNGKWNVYNTPIYTGSVTSATSTTLVDSNLSYGGHILDGDAVVVITGGTGSGQIRTISVNSGTSVTLTSAWTTTPDATSTFAIYKVPTTDGIHPGPTTTATMSNAINVSKLG